MLGAASPFLGLKYENFEAGIKAIFGKKGDDILKQNFEALKAGFNIAKQ